MRNELLQRYNDAMTDAISRGANGRCQDLYALLNTSVVTINVSTKVLEIMALPQPYLGYHKAIDAGLRHIAEARYHAHRKAVDAKISIGYEAEIIHGAISVDGSGLRNYGPVTVQLKIAAVADRATVLRENSYDFYDRFKLGDRDAQEEPGWRSIWADRAMLGVAHLAPEVTAASSVASLPSLVLFSGTDRNSDRYMEVHVFDSIVFQAVDRVTLARPLTDPEDQKNWDFAREKLTALGITVNP